MLRTDGTDGGPAFPIVTASTPLAPGMSLRDWFAGQALAGFAANPESWPLEYPTMAKMAYSQADAMLAERDK